MRRIAALMGVMVALVSPGAWAQAVSLSGSLGDKALLVIDGSPRTVAVGASVQGVKLLSVSGSDAVVEVGGKRVTLPLGGAQVNLGGAPSAGGGTQIVLTAGLGGHFQANGTINGRSVQFMVDTGATNIALSRDEAERIGLNWRNGQQGYTQTANGAVPVSVVSLNEVRVGDVTVHGVNATIVPMPMPMVLLGNSFLTRFQMKRENDTMTLVRRP
jgi:aspartyl protease family protein